MAVGFPKQPQGWPTLDRLRKLVKHVQLMMFSLELGRETGLKKLRLNKLSRQNLRRTEHIMRTCFCGTKRCFPESPRLIVHLALMWSRQVRQINYSHLMLLFVEV